MAVNQKMKDLAKDLALRNKMEFSTEDSNDALRVMIQEAEGITLDDIQKMSRKQLRRHKFEIFELIEVSLDAKIDDFARTSGLEDLVEYRNIALGDANLFTTPDNTYFKVSMIAEGTKNLRRQRLRDGEEFMVNTNPHGVKIYEEFMRFMTGRIDWAMMIDKVAVSFVKYINEMISNAFTGYIAENQAGTPYSINSSGDVPTEQEILEVAEHIRSEVGEDVKIYGTRLALNKLGVSKESDTDNRDRNLTGFYGYIAGIEAIAIDQYHKAGTTEFALSNDEIYLLPETQDKMIKVVNEGESEVWEEQAGHRQDLQLEYTLINRFGVAIVPSSVFGQITFTV